MTAAFTGTAIERNTAISSRKESPTTTPITHGRRRDRATPASMPAAATPPTSVRTPVPRVAAGAAAPPGPCTSARGFGARGGDRGDTNPAAGAPGAATP